MSERQSTSLTLLERLRSNDQEAWQRLLRLYGPLVEAWCRRAGVTGQDVEDVGQEVFQAVTTGLERFHRDREGDTFRGWLRGITRHKLLKLFERRQGQPQAQGGTDAQRRIQEVPGPVPSFPEQDDPADEKALHRRALELVRAEFDPRTWQAFWRTAVDGQAAPDASAELGMSKAAVRQAKSRVLRRLREELGELVD
ncbi:sigma-70 family RNA polymerase sigma factor [soil metagenome]